MALTAVQTVMGHEDQKTIHPFFAKPTKKVPPQESEVTQTRTAAERDNELDSKQADPDAPKRRGRRRKPEILRESSNDKVESKVQASLQDFGCVANGRVEHATEDTRSTLSADLTPPDAVDSFDITDRPRVKRRKTISPTCAAGQKNGALHAEVSSHHEGLQIEDDKPSNNSGSSRVDAPTGPSPCTGATEISQNLLAALATVISPLPLQTARDDHCGEGPGEHEIASNTKLNASTDITPPKRRMVRVSKNGRLLSSPVAQVESEKSTLLNGKGKRGRKSQRTKASFKIVIRYGSDVQDRQRIGRKIEDIMNSGTTSIQRPVTPKKKPSPPPTPAKPTHPFFLGKVSQKEEPQTAAAPAVDRSPSAPRHARKTAVTPGKLRAESQRRQLPQQTGIPMFGSGIGGSPGPRATGTIEAAWPNSESLHVRDIDKHDLTHTFPTPTGEGAQFQPRKRKNNIVEIPQDQDLLFRLSQQLVPSIYDQNSCTEGEPESPCLAHRLLTTGAEIQGRVQTEVTASSSLPHAAIQVHFNDIEHVLTAFDKGICESQSWVQKYAPTTAAQVLQVGKEADFLRDWLEKLTVKAVQGQKGGVVETAAIDHKRPPKKKRRTMDDDFVVSSDDDADDELVEISESEEYGRSHGSRSLKRSRMSRNKNVVIISGPHGCGKSATVYAVAKELGYEIFEINSGSRRSGKDILDRVGDMSENHLVNKERRVIDTKDCSEVREASAQDDAMSEALQRDIQSGRQGTMTSFFKSTPNTTSKAVATASPKPPVETNKALKQTINKSQATLPSAPKQRPAQKQSLILFEEADILFQEDQQFWAQVTKLAHHTKRPIIITCNNENLVPTFDLPLAAILRLSPAPTFLATDYMITLAAKEGHMLQRKAVADLYQSRDFDLRASITELNFWCQMALGDRKGGLEWIYQRWPPGKDVDQDGRTIRVASEATYQSGMGMLPHDLANAADTVGFDKEHYLLKDAWKEWGIRPDARETSSTCDHSDNPSPCSNLDALHSLDRFLDAASSADLFSRVGLPSYDDYQEELTDPTLPPIPDKERLNYTVDAPLLQVDHVSDFSNFDTDIFVQTTLGLERNFGSTALGVPLGVTEDRRYKEFIQVILHHIANKSKHHHIARPEFSAAFDILATPSSTLSSISSLYPLIASAFDRNFRIIVEDLAPYVRSIVSHEQRLEAERLRLSNLVCEGGRSKRPRTTRASRVALEGGTRASKRRERWFDKELNRELVMRTAGEDWAGLGTNAGDIEGSSITGESLGRTQEG